MAITRKPIPSAGRPPPSNHPPLPYPVSPSESATSLENLPSGPVGQRQQQLGESPHQFLDPPPPLYSHNSSVSDLSEGWVDGRYTEGDEHPAASQMGPARAAPAQETDIPNMLQAGARNETPPQYGSSNDLTRLDNLGEPTIPASLRVTPPPGSNNPFHRSRSSEGRSSSTERRNETSQEADIWTEIANTPPRGAHMGTPPPGSLPNVSGLNLQDGPPKQYRPYSPAPRVVGHQPSQSVATMEHTSEEQLFELSSSPIAGPGHGHSMSASEDVYSSLAELDVPAPPATPSQSIPAPQQPHSRPIHAPPLPERKETDLPIPVEELKGKAPAQENVLEPHRDPGLSVNVPPQQEPSRAEAETPTTQANRQRAETYQVKKIRWMDSVSPELRSTPIMVQNANGPCPLLALVNALTLSTPADVDTALVETLRTREQVTLGLLLDAVFDELMSGRRGNAAQDLPDVGELYSFLLTLHTGMNVNPRFVPPRKESTSLIDGFDTPVSPSFDDSRGPGGFEDTSEMQLYSTFAVPLMHGWLPPRTHPAYAALRRSAATYEDAQNLLFREEELEDKLQRQGLSAEEQQLLEDISTVKYFLNSAATQLTSYGLDVVTDSMAPGSIAILFRNDHFSTLYKHPRSGQLLTLVTDMGYAGHEEVVWESLVDVSGEACEFYSGDFRPVGFGGPPKQQGSAPTASHEDSGGWTTVPRSGKKGSFPPEDFARSSGRAPPGDEYNLPSGRNTEQEDADLALAMQLQEEEEDRQRQAEASRRADEDASQAFISAQQQQQPPAAPQLANTAPRNSSRRPNQPTLFPNHAAPPRINTSTNNTPRRPPPTQPQPAASPAAASPAARRPPARVRDPEAGEDAPPPPYEQAAQTRPYTGPVPSPGSDSYAQMRASNASSARDPFTRNRAASGYSQHRASMPGQPPPHPGTARRRASGAAGFALEGEGGSAYAEMQQGGGQGQGQVRKERERDKECVVM